MTDERGRAFTFVLTPGRRGDAPPAHALLAGLPPPAFCLADAAYDSDALRRFMHGRGTEPAIPNNLTRKRVHVFDCIRYRQRNVIGRTVGRLKDWRRIHMRYDKLARNFASAGAIAAILHGWC